MSKKLFVLLIFLFLSLYLSSCSKQKENNSAELQITNLETGVFSEEFPSQVQAQLIMRDLNENLSRKYSFPTSYFKVNYSKTQEQSFLIGLRNVYDYDFVYNIEAYPGPLTTIKPEFIYPKDDFILKPGKINIHEIKVKIPKKGKFISNVRVRPTNGTNQEGYFSKIFIVYAE